MHVGWVEGEGAGSAVTEFGLGVFLPRRTERAAEHTEGGVAAACPADAAGWLSALGGCGVQLNYSSLIVPYAVSLQGIGAGAYPNGNPVTQAIAIGIPGIGNLANYLRDFSVARRGRRPASLCALCYSADLQHIKTPRVSTAYPAAWRRQFLV